MASGEYFLTGAEKKIQEGDRKRESKENRKKEKVEKQAKLFEAPEEEDAPKTKKSSSSRPDIEDLKNKFLKKKNKS